MNKLIPGLAVFIMAAGAGAQTFEVKDVKRVKIINFKVSDGDAVELANSLSAPWVRLRVTDVDAFSKTFQSSAGTLKIVCEKFVSEKVKGQKIETNSCKITSIQDI